MGAALPRVVEKSCFLNPVETPCWRLRVMGGASMAFLNHENMIFGRRQHGVSTSQSIFGRGLKTIGRPNGVAMARC
jgi:hypothetical protein